VNNIKNINSHWWLALPVYLPILYGREFYKSNLILGDLTLYAVFFFIILTYRFKSFEIKNTVLLAISCVFFLSGILSEVFNTSSLKDSMIYFFLFMYIKTIDEDFFIKHLRILVYFSVAVIFVQLALYHALDYILELRWITSYDYSENVLGKNYSFWRASAFFNEPSAFSMNIGMYLLFMATRSDRVKALKISDYLVSFALLVSLSGLGYIFFSLFWLLVVMRAYKGIWVKLIIILTLSSCILIFFDSISSFFISEINSRINNDFFDKVGLVPKSDEIIGAYLPVYQRLIYHSGLIFGLVLMLLFLIYTFSCPKRFLAYFFASVVFMLGFFSNNLIGYGAILSIVLIYFNNIHSK
jgi:hypothetical protein